MSNVLFPQTGRATLDISTVSSGGGADSLLRTGDFAFESASLVDVVNSWRRWSVRLRALSSGAYNEHIVPLLLTPERRVQVRWGMASGSDVAWGTPEDCRVLNSVPQLQANAAEQSGYSFELILVGALYELDVIQRVAARQGKISDIVEALARAYSLDSLVEPTGGVPLALVQSYQSDFQFVERRLRGAAVSTSGIGGYYFYAEGGVLHFHTRDYRQEQWILPYNPAATDLVSVDDAQEHALAGGTEGQMVAYDPLSARTTVVETDPQRYVKFGRRLSQAAGRTLRAAHAGPNQASFEDGRLQAGYSLSRDRFERVSFSATNMPDLRAGRIVVLQLPDANDPAGGSYHVDRMHLTISGGIAAAAVTAVRGEIMGGRASASPLKAAGASNSVAAPFEAPGKGPNFSASSAPILGAGPSVQVKPAG